MKLALIACVLLCVFTAAAQPGPQTAISRPAQMTACAGNKCSNLVWAGTRYNSFVGDEKEPSGWCIVDAWARGEVRLTCKTTKPDQRGQLVEAHLHAGMAETGDSVIGGKFSWKNGNASGVGDFTMTWISAPPMQVAASVKSGGNGLTSGATAIFECDGDQCTRGGGGAVWLFEGVHGQGMWHYGAAARLMITQFDGHTIVIHREDPNPSYSSPRFADPKKRSDGVFFADYYGTIHGDRIDGTVVWNGGGSGRWYARLPEYLCNPFDECPLDAGQMVSLGKNAVKAQLYESGLRCFMMAGGQENSEAQSLAGFMLRKGKGVGRNDEMALRLLQKSAAHDDYNGEIGLAEMYESGIGTPKNPQQAAYWRNKAEARKNQIQEEQAAQAQRDALTGLLLFGFAAEMMSSDSSGSDSGSDQGKSLDRIRKNDRDLDYYQHGGTGWGAPEGYRCTTYVC